MGILGIFPHIFSLILFFLILDLCLDFFGIKLRTRKFSSCVMRVEKEKKTQKIRKLTTQKSAPELSYFTFFPNFIYATGIISRFRFYSVADRLMKQKRRQNPCPYCKGRRQKRIHYV